MLEEWKNVFINKGINKLYDQWSLLSLSHRIWWRMTPAATKGRHHGTGGADTHALPAPMTSKDEGCQLPLHRLRRLPRHGLPHSRLAHTWIYLPSSFWTFSACTYFYGPSLSPSPLFSGPFLLLWLSKAFGSWAWSGPFTLWAHLGLNKKGRPPPPQTLVVIWEKECSPAWMTARGRSRKVEEGDQLPPHNYVPPSLPPPPLVAIMVVPPNTTVAAATISAAYCTQPWHQPASAPGQPPLPPKTATAACTSCRLHPRAPRLCMPLEPGLIQIT